MLKIAVLVENTDLALGKAIAKLDFLGKFAAPLLGSFMSKTKYKYNPETLSYDEVEVTWRQRMWTILSYVGAGAIFAVISVILAWTFVDSPTEARQKRDLAFQLEQLERLNDKLATLEEVLADMEDRDDNLYRVIFEAEPLSKEKRNVGVGGSNAYRQYEGYTNSELISNTWKRLNRLARKMKVQSESFDQVAKLAREKEEMLASVPSVMPISQKNLKKAPGGYGRRIDPVYRVPAMHWGMDFSANTGTEIFSVGNGVVAKVETKKWGYGKYVVIDHGFGYRTLYAHMTKFNVKKGQKVNRGDVIGFVGSTGKSTAPHLHYEVHKYNAKTGHWDKVNPVNYYFNDLTPEQYEEMIRISSNSGKSFD